MRKDSLPIQGANECGVISRKGDRNHATTPLRPRLRKGVVVAAAILVVSRDCMRTMRRAWSNPPANCALVLLAVPQPLSCVQHPAYSSGLAYVTLRPLQYNRRIEIRLNMLRFLGMRTDFLLSRRKAIAATACSLGLSGLLRASEKARNQRRS